MNLSRQIAAICFLLLPVPVFAKDSATTNASFEVIENYKPYIAGDQSVVAWFGKRTVLVLDDDPRPEQRDAKTMSEILKAMDDIFDAFERVTGRHPKLTAPLKGRIRIEVSNKVGGGLAHHGRLGVGIGDGFFNGLYERFRKGKRTVDQVFFYEIARNYWMGDMNPTIDYHTSKGPQDYGWWTVGFNNAMSIFLPNEIESIDDMYYFGSNGAQFADGMESNLNAYLSDAQKYDWDNSWNVPLIPWKERTSVNDLMTGLLIRLHRDHGGNEFIKQLYREIPKRQALKSRSDRQGARDNFYEACSLAAKKDLHDFFADELRWKITTGRHQQVRTLVAAQEKKKAIGAIDPEMAERKKADDGLAWHDVTTWDVEGRILPDQVRQRWFDRFPSSAEKTVTSNVWNLSRHSAGMMVRFKTDATAIHVHYKLLSKNLAMSHMPATGVSGVDLYARDKNGKWRWVQVTRPSSQEVKTKLVSGLAPGFREFAAYLPLYNGVESMSIGVPPNSKFEKLNPRERPIVFYGTSITHGACASRPGMVHTAILGRRFDMPVVNLGFSGNGKMDAAVGDFLTQIDAAVYVIDCLPNMNAKMVSEKCVPLVKQIRAAKPNTPIVLVEDRRNTNSWILPARDAHHDANHVALKEAFKSLQSDTTKGLYYIDGDRLYGEDGDGATDGSHANDLGFMRQADVFAPVLKKAMKQ